MTLSRIVTRSMFCLMRVPQNWIMSEWLMFCAVPSISCRRLPSISRSWAPAMRMASPCSLVISLPVNSMSFESLKATPW